MEFCQTSWCTSPFILDCSNYISYNIPIQTVSFNFSVVDYHGCSFSCVWFIQWATEISFIMVWICLHVIISIGLLRSFVISWTVAPTLYKGIQLIMNEKEKHGLLPGHIPHFVRTKCCSHLPFFSCRDIDDFQVL